MVLDVIRCYYVLFIVIYTTPYLYMLLMLLGVIICY